MGNDSSNFKDEKPLHTVTLSGYWIYTSLVTVAQFRKFDNANRRKYDWTENKPTWDWIDDHPMVNINRKEASAYAKWAGVALPTEAQWENAARGGLEGREYPWGNDWNSSNCANSVSPNTLYSTKPVKSYPANEYGLFDMSGNVLQWCLDWYDPDYYNTPAATQEDPICKKAETYHVLRGGSWVDENEECFRCAYRNNSTNIQIDYKYPYVGFRCVTPKLSK